MRNFMRKDFKIQAYYINKRLPMKCYRIGVM